MTVRIMPSNYTDFLIFNPLGENLIKYLFQLLQRWRMASQPTTLPVEHHMHETVALGVGSLAQMDLTHRLDPGTNLPVYLSEPLVVLHLSTAFETYQRTRKQEWIADSFRTVRSSTALGEIFEEATAMVLLDMFGGKPRALSDAFHCDQPWGSRKVTLVALTRTADDRVQCSPASWTSGGSDRWGYKAASPADVLEFFKNPNGKAFLFPDSHMGPDVMCFLRDEASEELILVGLQAKSGVSINAQTWMSALDSVMPQFFYTANVCIISEFVFFCSSSIFPSQTKEGRVQYAPLKYPELAEDLRSIIDLTVGLDEYKPAVEKHYRLRSSTSSDQTESRRQTPRYLRIIATPDDKQNLRLKAERQGDLGILRWACVEQLVGSTAGVVGNTSQSVQ
jgi:hypothetical protein